MPVEGNMDGRGSKSKRRLSIGDCVNSQSEEKEDDMWMKEDDMWMREARRSTGLGKRGLTEAQRKESTNSPGLSAYCSCKDGGSDRNQEEKRAIG